MSIITPIQRYLPHELHTRIHAVKLYRSEHEIFFVCRRYKVSKSSLLRWNKRYDGTPGSLMDRSHRPHTPHPNSHTPEEIKWVRNLVRRTPDISCPELWWKLHRKKGYHRHPGSLRRLLIRLGLHLGKAASTKEKHVPMPYDTPTSLGVKWQMDVKYVPAACYASQDGQKFYQYTMIDEAARKRFIYPYMEQSSASTCDFIRRAILFFKYVPAFIQTDNGSEFTYTRKTVCDTVKVPTVIVQNSPSHRGNFPIKSGAP
ncbi:MAG: DDE-type integrase/transposase/recombinase [Selenomonas bovis]|nr:DDE-type integrase/transposase/recombinase [Selenomonas bovis]